MWFKNGVIYKLANDWRMSSDEFEEALQRGAYVAPGSQDVSSRGWVPSREGGSLVDSIGGQWLIALKLSKRNLPAAVVAERVSELAREIADQRGYPPGRKELRELKDRAIQELLPRAFVKHEILHAWVSPDDGWLVVNAGSPSKAEELLEHLRVSLEELPVRQFRTQISPSAAMLDWLASGEAPMGMTVDQECELKTVDEKKSSVKYTRHSLDGEDVKVHLSSGKIPSSLALTWDDRVSFILTDAGHLKRIAFLDTVLESAEVSADDADEVFEVDFTLMTGELRKLLPDLGEALGGEIPDEEGSSSGEG